jgi:hypothetical protein
MTSAAPVIAISLSAPDTTNAENVLAIAKRPTSGDTVSAWLAWQPASSSFLAAICTAQLFSTTRSPSGA